MGLSTKKQTQKTNQNTTMSTQPTNPTFVTQGIEDLSGRIRDTFAGIDPSKWTLGSNPLQTQAAGLAAGLGDAGDSFGRAIDTVGGVLNQGPNLAGVTTADAASIADNIKG